MNDKEKTAEILAEEVASLKRRIADLEEADTLRRRGDEELRVSAEKYRILFESFPLGISITDDRGNILESNAEVDRLFRRLGRRKQRKTIFDPDLKVIRPDGSDKPIEEYPSVLALRENRLVTGVEVGIDTGEGEIVWVSVTAAPIPLDGYGVVIAYKDVTERKLAEEALLRSRRLLEKTFASLKDAVFIIDATTLEIIDCNPAAGHIFRYSAEEMMGRTPAFLHVNKATLEQFRKHLYKALEEKDFLHLPRFRMKRKDGTVFFTEQCIMPIQDEMGKRLYWVSVIRDITERLKTEEALEIQKEQLRALALKLESLQEEERAHLAREIHDQFGQSFTALKMDISFLLKRIGKDDETLREKARAMIEMIEKNIELVRNLSTKLRPSILDDLGLAAAVEWQASEFEERTGIRCIVQSNLNHVALDRSIVTALFRISQEALTNAARHSRATEVRIDLKAGKEAIRLEIRDNGKGISRSEMTGINSLGILGMKERAAILGGSFNIRGGRGKGTLIRVRIPLNRYKTPVS